MAVSKPFRSIRVLKPFSASMRIIQAFGRPIVTGTAKVNVLKLQLGSVAFSSYLRLPVEDQITLELQWGSDEDIVQVRGVISDQLLARKGRHVYELQLEPDPARASAYRRYMQNTAKQQQFLMEKISALYRFFALQWDHAEWQQASKKLSHKAE